MKEYGLYDVKDYEQCIYVGTLKEMSIYLGCNSNSLRSYLVRKKNGIQELLQRRYELIEIQEEDDDENEEYIRRKSNKEIFQELIRDFTGLDEILTLQEEIAKLEIFDEFKWLVKGIVDKVIVDEEWKKIPQFDYSLSNYGRLRNDKNGKLKALRYHRWIIQADIYNDGKRYTIDIPRLEASLFIRKLEKNERVSFKDGDKRNLYYKNLQIVNKRSEIK